LFEAIHLLHAVLGILVNVQRVVLGLQFVENRLRLVRELRRVGMDAAFPGKVIRVSLFEVRRGSPTPANVYIP
jgi:hypothetical protein